MTEQPQASQTKLQLYCNALYNIFDEDSEVINLEPDGPIRIWRGYVTQASARCEIPEGVRNRVISRLEDVGCIQVIERGRRNVPSVVVLLAAPTAEVWDAYDRDFTLEGLTRRPDPAILGQQIRDMNEQIGGLPIRTMFQNLETRLKSVEDRLEEIEKAEGSKKPQG